MRNQRDKSGYLSEETIAAIATATGGAISIVRISGSRAFEVLQILTQSKRVSQAEPRKMIRAHLYSIHSPSQTLSEDNENEKKQLLDDALFVRFVSPESYTGEDLVEFHIHGGHFIAHRFMETLQTLGVRQALPGEFSFRAVRNGKMNLLQAQAVADLISASNEGAITLALEKMSGTQSALLEELASSLRRMAVLGEVGIDFADQDVDEVALPRLQSQLTPLLSLLENLKTSYHRGIRLQEGIGVAFVGLPNAGKSSFFNALLGEDRSIVSDIEGTTRDIVREKLTLRGKKSTITLRLEDTAGLRLTENRVEQMGIERTQKASQEADLILFIVDPFSVPEAVKEQWKNLQKGATHSLSAKTIGIMTKLDRLSSQDLLRAQEQLRHLQISTWMAVSSISGAGITQAVDQIVEFCERWTHRNQKEVLLTRLDHFAAVSEAILHLVRAQNAPEIDLFASDLRQTLHSLGPLIGETVPDDILGKIFSDFCIGK